MRLLLDPNLSPRRIGGTLRRRDHDVVALADPELEGLVTRNSRDFAPICRAWAEAGREHAGVVLIWTLSHHEFSTIDRGVEEWLDAIPTQRAWRGIVAAI